MVVLMEHALSATGPLTLSTAPSDKEVNAQLYSVLVMLVKDEAMQKGRTCVVGHGSEIWRLPCKEHEFGDFRHSATEAEVRV